MKNMNLPNLYESQVRGWNSSGKHIGEWGATTALIAPKSTGGLMLNPTWEILLRMEQREQSRRSQGRK